LSSNASNLYQVNCFFIASYTVRPVVYTPILRVLFNPPIKVSLLNNNPTRLWP